LTEYLDIPCKTVSKRSSQLIRHMADASSRTETLDLNALGETPGMPGLTPSAGQYLVDGAAVCLDLCNHCVPITLSVTGWRAREYDVICPEVTDQKQRTHNDHQEATEIGACAVAISVIHDLTGFAVVERSRKGTGIDYWLGDDNPYPIQRKARLEVSGILRETPENSVDERMRRKCSQIEQSDHTRLEAFVVVVEFGHPMAKVVKR